MKDELTVRLTDYAKIEFLAPDADTELRTAELCRRIVEYWEKVLVATSVGDGLIVGAVIERPRRPHVEFKIHPVS